jgi:4-amino-4-deoxy-L-arabinose transferase-like glycosyltransferase
MEASVGAESTSAQTKSRFARDFKAWHLYFIFLTLIVIASAGVRAGAWHHWRTGAIESEGAEYARIAENLREGRGYVGISTPGTQLVFAPLFPSLIAAASVVTHNDYELAGRLVTFLLGVMLPLPVFGIAIRLFHWRTAAIAAALVVVFPLFINLSFTVFSEGPYITVLLTAVYLVLSAFDHPSVLSWFLVGGAFGSAYLIRQEAVGPLLLALLLGSFARDAAPVMKIKRAAAALAVFIVLALPQVLLLYRSTGKLRLEGKSAINYAWGIRAMAEHADSRSDQSVQETDYDAANSINDRLEETGVGMRPNADIIRETHVHIKDLLHFFLEAVRGNTPELFAKLRERWLGAPFLPALALLGALRRPWPRRTALHHLYFVLIPTTAVLTTFTVVHAIYVRYYFVLTPFFLVWGANGLVEAARWTNANILLFFRRRNAWLPGALVAGLTAVLMLNYSFKDTRSLFVFREGSLESLGAKDAGLWIQKQQTRRVRVMDVLDTVAFHADADYVHFPSCNPGVAIRYIEKEKVDYVVFRQGFDQPRYYKDWLQSRIPDARAQLVYATAEGDPNGIRVFRWNQPAANRP